MTPDNHALVLIDLQVGIFAGRGGDDQRAADARLDALCLRLGAFARRWLEGDRPLVLVQHHGGPGHRLAAGSAGWALRPEFAGLPAQVVAKSDCDSFFATCLETVLNDLGVAGVVIGGCMTEYCIDTTCRSAVAHGFDAILLADGHATVDDGLAAERIIAHHNRVLADFGAGDRRVTVTPTDRLRID